MEFVVVTGAAGFVGAALSRRLIADGVQIIGVDNLSTSKLENLDSELEFIEGDVADPQALQQLPTAVARVFHLARQSSRGISTSDPVGDLDRDVATILRLT